MRVFALLLPLCVLAGCTQFPTLDTAVSASAKSADFPALVNLDEILHGGAAPRITPQTTAGLQNRVAALRARAARLQRPVIEPARRARILAAQARLSR